MENEEFDDCDREAENDFANDEELQYWEDREDDGEEEEFEYNESDWEYCD